MGTAAIRAAPELFLCLDSFDRKQLARPDWRLIFNVDIRGPTGPCGGF